MKIDKSNSVLISGKLKLQNLFTGLKKGADVHAKIIERLGKNDAILEIAGKRIKTEFVKGIPAKNNITLRLIDDKNNTFSFKIIDTGKNEILENLAKLTIFKVSELQKKNFFNLIQNSAKFHPGIFEINKNILFPGKNKGFKSFNLAAILNNLLKNGINVEKIFNLVMILQDSLPIQNLILSIYSLSDLNKKYYDNWVSNTEAEIGKEITEILSEIMKSPDVKDKSKIINQLIDLILNNTVTEKNINIGEIYFFDDEKFVPVQYLINDNSYLFTLNLSTLGIIDILIKQVSGYSSITFFSSDDEILKILEDSIDQLYAKINNFSENINIKFYNKRNILDKLQQASMYYTTNSEFNIMA